MHVAAIYPGLLALALAGLCAAGGAQTPAAPGGSADAVPSWLYPTAPAPKQDAAADPSQALRLKGSAVAFPRKQLGDLFSAPDWYPGSHLPMPDVVEHGRAPFVYACGYCHSPTGQGRPENAALAGLPVAYVIRQVHDFRSGARRSAAVGPYPPADFMVQVAKKVGDDELARAAGYFAQQTLRPRVRVVEAARVPRAEVVGLVYAAIPGGGDEPLGERLMEFAPDPKRHELRDERLRYLAYVPPASLARGRQLARSGVNGPATACVTCHGANLKGTGAAPPLAGRSPTYLLRSLYAFRVGARTAATAAPMQPIAKALTPSALIDAAAYAASLDP
jgi:cytochrome c553